VLAPAAATKVVVAEPDESDGHRFDMPRRKQRIPVRLANGKDAQGDAVIDEKAYDGDVNCEEIDVESKSFLQKKNLVCWRKTRGMSLPRCSTAAERRRALTEQTVLRDACRKESAVAPDRLSIQGSYSTPCKNSAKSLSRTRVETLNFVL
jgi:hypothetical protein